MRQKINLALKHALRENNDIACSTLRLMMAVIKDADIAARSVDSQEGLSDENIFKLLQTMIKQRQKKGVKRELVEVAIIESFLPQKANSEKTKKMTNFTINELNIQNTTKVGKVTATMKKLYPKGLTIYATKD